MSELWWGLMVSSDVSVITVGQTGLKAGEVFTQQRLEEGTGEFFGYI